MSKTLKKRIAWCAIAQTEYKKCHSNIYVLFLVLCEKLKNTIQIQIIFFSLFCKNFLVMSTSLSETFYVCIFCSMMDKKVFKRIIQIYAEATKIFNFQTLQIYGLY